VIDDSLRSVYLSSHMKIIRPATRIVDGYETTCACMMSIVGYCKTSSHIIKRCVNQDGALYDEVGVFTKTLTPIAHAKKNYIRTLTNLAITVLFSQLIK